MASSADPQAGIFRQRALERQTEQESIDALLRVTAPHEWIIATGLVVLLLGCLVWGLLGRIELNMQIDGVLARAGERGVIVSALPGRILDLPAGPGDAIAAGAVVATLEPADLQMRLRLVEAREAALLQARLSELRARAEALQALEAAPAGADGRLNESISALETALQSVQAERLELDALRDSGSRVVSSRPAEISALLVGVGEAVDAGMPIAQVRFEDPGPPEAVAFLGPEQAARLQVGMAARILVETPEGEPADVMQAELSSVSEPRSLPSWLGVTSVGMAEAGTPGAPAGRLARFSIVAGDAPEFDDLSPARLEVTLGRVTPFQLLFAQ